MFDNFILNTFLVDYIVRGEDEVALRALCRTGARRGDRKRSNLSWRDRRGNVVRNLIPSKISKI